MVAKSSNCSQRPRFNSKARVGTSPITQGNRQVHQLPALILAPSLIPLPTRLKARTEIEKVRTEIETEIEKTVRTETEKKARILKTARTKSPRRNLPPRSRKRSSPFHSCYVCELLCSACFLASRCLESESLPAGNSLISASGTTWPLYSEIL